MASAKFLYLDSTPIDEALLVPNKELGQAIDYRRQLNLAINCVQAENTLANQYKLLRGVLENNSELTVMDLNKVLESFLNLLIPISTITTLDQSALTSHYQRRKLVVPGHFLAPDSNYLEEILLTSVRTWGTAYGSLGYNLHQDQVREHYLHPSQIIDLAVAGAFKRMHSSELLGQFADRFLSLVDMDDAGADLQIYKTQTDFLEIPAIREIAIQLEFYSQWLPQVLDWYLKPHRDGKPLRVEPQGSTPQDEAIRVLISIATTCLNLGLDDTSFENLLYLFVHQSIPPVFFTLTDELLLLRKKNTFNPLSSTFTEEEKLLTPFVNAITLNSKMGALRGVSYQLLSDLCAPGGYNLLLVSVAATLLNRAYILTHPTNTSLKDVTIFPLKTGLQPVLELLGRTFRLIYLAGYSLLKSDLPHLQTVGSNLVEFSSLESSSIDLITDLTQ